MKKVASETIKFRVWDPVGELKELKSKVEKTLKNTEEPHEINKEDSQKIYLFFSLGVTQIEQMSNNLILKRLIDEDNPKTGGTILGEIIRKNIFSGKEENLDGLLGTLLGTRKLDRFQLLKMLEKISQSDKEEIMVKNNVNIIDGNLKNKMCNFRGTRNEIVHNAGKRYAAPNIRKGQKEILTVVKEGWEAIEKLDDMRRRTVDDLAQDIKTVENHKEKIVKKKPISFSTIKDPWTIDREKRT